MAVKLIIGPLQGRLMVKMKALTVRKIYVPKKNESVGPPQKVYIQGKMLY